MSSDVPATSWRVQSITVASFFWLIRDCVNAFLTCAQVRVSIKYTVPGEICLRFLYQAIGIQMFLAWDLCIYEFVSSHGATLRCRPRLWIVSGKVSFSLGVDTILVPRSSDGLELWRLKISLYGELFVLRGACVLCGPSNGFIYRQMSFSLEFGDILSESSDDWYVSQICLTATWRVLRSTREMFKYKMCAAETEVHFYKFPPIYSEREYGNI